jgi:glycosyltransferase involved in cell wall biosynthesis
MKLLISLEARFCKTPDQKIWSENIPSYLFWQRYLEVFDSIEIIARVQNVSSVFPGYKRADGEKVKFIPLPCYIGPYQYLENAIKAKRIAKSAAKYAEAVILRTPGQVSSNIFHYLRKNKHPYGVEVVGDPYDVFAPGAVDHLLRFFFRRWGTKQLKTQCQEAMAAAYVTEYSLQQRYPHAPDAFSTHYSSIELSEAALVDAPRVFSNHFPIKLISVGTMEQLYKAQNVLIDAMAICVRRGLDLQLLLLGNGKHRAELEARSIDLGLRDRTIFLGQVAAGKAVIAQLDDADIFILPSHQEGLPRSMIEAMARGLPCIGSTVGGIPELLPPEDMVSPGDAKALAAKIREVVGDPLRMNKMSTRNLKKANNYQEHVLEKRRREFYQAVKNRTIKWIAKR